MGQPRLPRVAFSILGPNLDQGKGVARWERWRPTVALARHEDLLLRRLELLYQPTFLDLARLVADDVRHLSPETEVNLHAIDLKDPWDFEEVYGALHDVARAYPFAPEREEYLVPITTGTHVAQICLFLLTESRHFPAKLLQTSPPRRDRPGSPGTYAVIDLDLSRYDRLASRFQAERRDNLAFLKSGIDTRNEAFNRRIERIAAEGELDDPGGGGAPRLVAVCADGGPGGSGGGGAGRGAGRGAGSLRPGAARGGAPGLPEHAQPVGGGARAVCLLPGAQGGAQRRGSAPEVPGALRAELGSGHS